MLDGGITISVYNNIKIFMDYMNFNDFCKLNFYLQNKNRYIKTQSHKINNNNERLSLN